VLLRPFCCRYNVPCPWSMARWTAMLCSVDMVQCVCGAPSLRATHCFGLSRACLVWHRTDQPARGSCPAGAAWTAWSAL
jgi:hypothetical protein